MKYLPLIAITAELVACANHPVPAGTQSVGTSLQPSAAVAQCIARKWANRSQQQVVSQSAAANNQAIDVYMPGQQPPNGAAAIVRPAWSPSAKTWAGLRTGGAVVGDAAGDVSRCL